MEIFDTNYVRHPVSFFVTNFLNIETAALARAYLGITSGTGDVTASGTLTSHTVILGNGTTIIKAIASIGSAGQVLTSNGAGSDPTFQTPGAGSGDVSAPATLVDNQLVIGTTPGAKDVATLGSLGTTTTVLHGNAGGAPTFATVVEADITLADNTTNNVSSTKHGLTPKSPASTTQFLNGAATPAFAQVKDSDLSTSDITTNDVTIAKHGFCPKAPNDASKFLDGTGTFSTPPGGGTVTNTGTLTDHGVVVGNGGTDISALSVGTTNTLLHGITGADPAFSAVVEADISLSNNTTNDVSTTKHGFAPKAPNDANQYLDGTGSYSVPAGSGGTDYFWDYLEASMLPIGTTTSYPLNCGRSETTGVNVSPTATEPPGLAYTTTASVNNVVSCSSVNVTQFVYNRAIEFRSTVATGATITSYRMWGAVLSAVAPATIGASDLAAALFCGFRFSTSAGDTKWMCVFNDNAGNSEALDSGVTVSASTVYRLKITWDGTTTGKVKFYINGSLVQTSTFDFPSLSRFAFFYSLTTLANATRTFNGYGMRVRQYYP